MYFYFISRLSPSSTRSSGWTQRAPAPPFGPAFDVKYWFASQSHYSSENPTILIARHYDMGGHIVFSTKNRFPDILQKNIDTFEWIAPFF